MSHPSQWRADRMLGLRAPVTSRSACSAASADDFVIVEQEDPDRILR
ncbi:hypothetical protein ABZ707_15490 [Streptomyces sp. NPDC006923]